MLTVRNVPGRQINMASGRAERPVRGGRLPGSWRSVAGVVWCSGQIVCLAGQIEAGMSESVTGLRRLVGKPAPKQQLAWDRLRVGL